MTTPREFRPHLTPPKTKKLAPLLGGDSAGTFNRRILSYLKNRGKVTGRVMDLPASTIKSQYARQPSSNPTSFLPRAMAARGCSRKIEGNISAAPTMRDGRPTTISVSASTPQHGKLIVDFAHRTTLIPKLTTANSVRSTIMAFVSPGAPPYTTHPK